MTYSEIKPQNMSVRISHISLPFQMVQSSGLFQTIDMTYRYNLTECDFPYLILKFFIEVHNVMNDNKILSIMRDLNILRYKNIKLKNPTVLG